MSRKIIINESQYQSIINEEKIGNKFYVYHCGRPNTFMNIFYSGFESFYIKTGAGDRYGPGVYTTTDIKSSIHNAHKGTYGNIIIRAELLDINHFIIFDENIAKSVYGENYTVEQQFNTLFGSEDIQAMKNARIYDYIVYKKEFYTSKKAYKLYEFCLDHKSAYDSYEGLVFRGGNDGNVAVVKHVKNLLPVAYSKDYGRTFIEYSSEETIDNTVNSFDPNYILKNKKYAKTFPAQGGLAKVENNEGKFNFINKDLKEFSPMWFDSASNFTKDLDGNYITIVFIGNDKFYITTNGDMYESMDDVSIANVQDLAD